MVLTHKTYNSSKFPDKYIFPTKCKKTRFALQLNKFQDIEQPRKGKIIRSCSTLKLCLC